MSFAGNMHSALAAVPYIAIQLKAISGSFDLFTRHLGGTLMAGEFVIADFLFLSLHLLKFSPFCSEPAMRMQLNIKTDSSLL